MSGIMSQDKSTGWVPLDDRELTLLDSDVSNCPYSSFPMPKDMYWSLRQRELALHKKLAKYESALRLIQEALK